MNMDGYGKEDGTHGFVQLFSTYTLLLSRADADQISVLGRYVCIPSSLVHVLAHVALATALLTSRRHTSTLQHVHTPLLRLRFLLSYPRCHRTQPPHTQPQSTDLDRHFDCPTFSLFLYTAGYFSGTGQG